MHRRFRLFLELLETRRLPSTVTNLSDHDPGSLRDAIASTPAGGTVDFQRGLTGTITRRSSTSISCGTSTSAILLSLACIQRSRRRWPGIPRSP
jgi:hypothetical protein